jgi:hypothetical protein
MPMIILFGILLIILTDLNFKFSFMISLIVILLSNFLMEFELFIESFETLFDSIVFGIYLSSKIKNYKKHGEYPHISRRIIVNDKGYRVISFTKSPIPEKNLLKSKFHIKNKKKDVLFTGYVILDDNFCEVQDIQIIKKVLYYFKIWHYVYINPILGKNGLDITKKKLTGHIKFIKKFLETIRERKSDNYVNIKHEEYIKILKELDDQVLHISKYILQKNKLIIKILNNLIIIFKYPSDILYDDIINKFNKIKEFSREENKIWRKRLKTYKKLKEIQSREIEKLPKPSLLNVFRASIVDIFNIFLFKDPPVPRVTIIVLFFEIVKGATIKLSKFLINEIEYNILTYKVISSNIETNKLLISQFNKLKSILSEKDINLVRNKI